MHRHREEMASEVAAEAAVAAGQGVRHSKRVDAIVHVAQEQV